MSKTRAFFVGASLNSNWLGGEPKIAKDVINGFIERQVSVKTLGLSSSDSFNTINSPLNPFDLNPFYFRRYLEAIGRFHPNIIFNWFDFDSTSLVASLALNVPTVASVHTHWPVCPKLFLWNNGSCVGPSKERCYYHVTFQRHIIYKICSLYGQSLHLAMKKRVERLNKIDAIIVPSNFMRAKLIEQGVQSGHINVIHNGVNLKTLEKTGDTEEQIVSTKIRYVLYIGPASEQKGFFDFVKMAKVLKETCDVRFLAVGNNTSIGPVHALGYLDRNGLNGLLGKSYVVVFPSLWDEPFGLVPVEAMAMRKPVVAYSVGAVPETTYDGLTGFLVPKGRFDMLADRVKELLANQGLAEKMGFNGRKIVEQKFDSLHMIDKYYALMKKIVG